MAIRFDGRAYADNLLTNLSTRIPKLKNKPTLGIILLGNDPASLSYINQKLTKAATMGAEVQLVQLPESTSEKELLLQIRKFNKDPKITGYIVQLPLPEKINQEKVFEAIDPKKDLDCFNPESTFVPPPALAILGILKEAGVINVQGRKVLVIGRGQTAGKPIILELIKRGAIVTIADKSTKNVPYLCGKAEMVVSCAGAQNLINAEMLKKDAILIGVGIIRGEDGKLHGDYEEENVSTVASFYTPTPGGVGPVTVAFLLSNLVEAAAKK